MDVNPDSYYISSAAVGQVTLLCSLISHLSKSNNEYMKKKVSKTVPGIEILLIFLPVSLSGNPLSFDLSCDCGKQSSIYFPKSAKPPGYLHFHRWSPVLSDPGISGTRTDRHRFRHQVIPQACGKSVGLKNEGQGFLSCVQKALTLLPKWERCTTTLSWVLKVRISISEMSFGLEELQ